MGTLFGGLGSDTVVDSFDGSDFTRQPDPASQWPGCPVAEQHRPGQPNRGAGDNDFTVSGWTGGAFLSGGSGGTDSVISSNNANFTLSQTSLTRSDGGVSHSTTWTPPG